MSGEITQLLSSLHPLERKVLGAFRDHRDLWDHELIQETGLDESRLSMALGWLLTKGVLLVKEEKATEFVSITDLGRRYAIHKIPEKRILSRLRAGERFTIRDLPALEGLEPQEVSKAVGNLKAFEIVRVSQGGQLELAKGELPPLIDPLLIELLKRLSDAQPVKYEDLLMERETGRAELDILLRSFLEKQWKTHGGVVRLYKKKSRCLALTERGRVLVQSLIPEMMGGEELAQLTPDLLKDGAWRGRTFRKYNIGLKPPRILVGKKHPYREFLDGVKAKLVAMGFKEMRGPLVETEFWDMDVLYMPQFHPARDIHDVYFVKDPQFAKSIPEPYLHQVATTHESGWKTGSAGWRYHFDLERARRLILRSQGTAVSARTLADHPDIPGKYFSMARCFRYDQVDATHACDFFQVEGIVLGEEINFRTLLGLLQLFALEVARAKTVKFLPAYFPFTEPSVELHVQHPKLGWMELGGAGLFRPEVTRPLGVEVPVIAWGLGLDRMAMVALEISDIRDLFSSDLDLIRTKRMKI